MLSRLPQLSTITLPTAPQPKREHDPSFKVTVSAHDGPLIEYYPFDLNRMQLMCGLHEKAAVRLALLAAIEQLRD